MGCVVILFDRPGHGRSAGRWFPRLEAESELDSFYPDIRSAVEFAQSEPSIDSERIGLVGHSDGGTGSIISASADWNIQATVSMSASVAPLEYVNHFVPRNLLLIYGGADQFILDETDSLLIRNATRGFLKDAGSVGPPDVGSSRRLLRVPGYGHVDLVYSEDARRAVLDWIGRALAVPPPVALAPSRLPWVVAGVVCLMGLVAIGTGAARDRRPAHPGLQALTLGSVAMIFWGLSLWLAGRLVPTLSFTPVQEGNVVVSVLVSATFVMGSFVFLRMGFAGRWNPLADVGVLGWQLAGGVGLGICTSLLVEVIFRPMYLAPITGQRVVLAGAIFPVATLAFAAICLAASSLKQWNAPLCSTVPLEAGFSLMVWLVSFSLFERMSVLPVLVLSLVLALVGAYRWGGGRTAVAITFGATLYARLASLVCAFY